MAERIRIIEVFLDESGFKKPEFICEISNTKLINVKKRVENEEIEFTLIDKETAFVRVEEKDVETGQKDYTMLILAILGILLTTAGVIISLIQS